MRKGSGGRVIGEHHARRVPPSAVEDQNRIAQERYHDRKQIGNGLCGDTRNVGQIRQYQNCDDVRAGRASIQSQRLA